MKIARFDGVTRRGGGWIPGMDSNHDSQIQSLLSCHWTTGEFGNHQYFQIVTRSSQHLRSCCLCLESTNEETLSTSRIAIITGNQSVDQRGKAAPLYSQSQWLHRRIRGSRTFYRSSSRSGIGWSHPTPAEINAQLRDPSDLFASSGVPRLRLGSPS